MLAVAGRPCLPRNFLTIHSVARVTWAVCVRAVWRPVLDNIDPGDGKKREAILLGDVFMPGPGPPNFPSTMLVRA